jgi:outer membrane immunogenic protein
MKRIGSVLAFLNLGCGSALAADLPVRKDASVQPLPSQPINWAGFYIGFAGGWIDPQLSKPGFPGISAGGGTFGARMGYNFQIDSVVFGIEVDGAFVNARKTQNIASVAIPGNYDVQTYSQNWLMTARPRIGYALGDFMPYLTAGIAGTNIRNKDSNFNAGIPTYSRITHTIPGWTVGAGGEYRVWRNVSVTLEYLYADFGKKQFVVTDPKTSIADHTVRGGFNIRF